MSDKGTAAIEDLLDALETAGFEVTNVGARYRVTSPEGGKPAFIPHRMPKASNLSLVVQGLRNIGFDMAKAQEVAETRRQERLQADREKEARLLAVAEQASSERARQAAKVAATKAPAKPTTSPFVPPQEAPERRPEGQRTETVLITGPMAQDWLARNRFYEPSATHAGKCNRRLSPALVESYSQAMLRGEWITTHQGIAFDVDGDLADGQHRLAAVVLAAQVKPDIEVPFMVTHGLPLAAMDRIDVGRKRMITDFLEMRGEPGAFNLAATLRLIILYDTVPYSPTAWRVTYATAEQSFALLQQEPAIRDASRRGHLCSIGLPSAMAAGLHLAQRHWPEEMWLDFYAKLRTGGDVQAGSAVHGLREALIRQKTNPKYKRSAPEQFAMFVKAWNLHVHGKGSKVLAWSANEGFPEVSTPRPAPKGR